MLINFDVALCTVYNDPLRDGNGENAPILTLGRACVGALLGADARGLSGADKVARWSLALKIQTGEHSLDIEEVALLKKLVGEFYGPVVVGPAFAELESASA